MIIAEKIIFVLIYNCEHLFNLNWVSAKNDKTKSQSFKVWSRKCARIYALCASNSNNNNKSNHNVYIIIDEDYKFNSDKSYKCLKN